MTRALVLAAESCLGWHICDALEAGDHTVAATSFEPLAGRDTELCDLCDFGAVAEIVAGARPQWIVNCAGVTQTNEVHDLYGLHIGGASNLLAALREHCPEAVTIFFGSAAEYGPVPPEDLPVAESHRGVPAGFFGASKLAQTHLVGAAAAEWALRVLVVRPSNVVGPRLGPQYLASALAERLRGLPDDPSGRELAVVNGAATRDFVDPRDVAAAALALLENASPEPGRCDVYNIATGGETPVLELARILAELAGDVRVYDAGAGASRTGIDRSCLDPGKLIAATGWRPRIPLQRSLADLWATIPSPR